MSKNHRHSRRTWKRFSGADLVISALCITFFVFSAAVVLILYLRPLYYIDMGLLRISELSGMSEAAMKENYDILINYNLLWNRGDLVFKGLAMSDQGRIHFQECKRIFDIVQIICIVTGIGTVITAIRCHKKHDRRPERYASIMTLVIPVVLAAIASINFDRFFVAFHHLFFRNDYWLFDPETDPVILMLPETFFMHCAIGIALVIIAGAVVLIRAGRRR